MASEDDKTAPSTGKPAGTPSDGGKETPGGAKAAAGARGKPVTIDLKAEEVRNESAKTAAAKAETVDKSEAAMKAAPPGPDAGKQTPPPKTGEPSSTTARKPEAEPDAKKPEPAKSAKGTSPAQSSGMGRPIIAAAIGGGIALVGAYAASQFSGGPNVDRVLEDLQLTLSDTDGRFRQLEAQLTELKQVEAGPAVAPSVVSELAGRIEALESSAAGVVQGADVDRETTETLRADVTVLTEGLAEIRRFVSTGSAGESAGLATLSDTVDTMQSTVSDLRSELEDDVLARLEKLEGGANRDAALSEALADIEERMGALDGRVNSVAEAANAAAKAVTEGDTVTNNSISTFGERLDTLGKALTKVDEAATALDGRVVATTMRADGFVQSQEELTAKLDEMSERIGEIETVVGGPGAREMASRAVAVSLLKSAVDSGRPYGTEIAAVRVALPADTDLSALEQSAETGIAPMSRLIAQFPDVARVMAGTLEKVDTGNSVVDKFLNNARSLVSVRATGDVVGGGPMAAIGRMEARVREGDLDAALEIYETLPDGTQAAGKEWAAAARGRLSADRLVDQVTADVIKALAASDS